MIFADYETRSRLNIKKVGTYRYVNHDSTEPLFVAYHRPGQAPGIAKRLADVVYSDDVVVHWGSIDRMVGEDIEGLECLFFDASVLARMVGRPGKLEECAKSFGRESGKHAAGTRLINKYSKMKLDFWTEADPQDMIDFMDYAAIDVELLEFNYSKLRHLIPDWIKHQRWIYEMVERMNYRGVPTDEEACHAAIEDYETWRNETEAECVAITGLRPTQTEKIRQWLEEEAGRSIPNVRRETLEALEVEGVVERVVEARLAASLAAVKKVYGLRDFAVDRRVHDCFIDHGAHTGRLTSLGIQFQNFKKGNPVEGYFEALHAGTALLEFPNFADVMAESVRGFIAAPPGRKLIQADYSAIEARVGAWTAGEQILLESFEKNLPVYEMMAADIFRVSVDEVNRYQRFIGKTAVLGSQYQASADGLGPMMGDDRYTIDEWGEEQDMAELAVRTYRARFTHIVAYWGRLNRSAINAVREPGRTFNAGPVAFETWGEYLLAILPSGRRIYYFQPEVRDRPVPWNVNEKRPSLHHYRKAPQSQRWIRTATYGGRLMENVVQAISFDIMAHGMLNAEAAGFEPFMSVHDEVVAETDENVDHLERFIECLCDAPSWAKGIPITAEGWIDDRYKKG